MYQEHKQSELRKRYFVKSAVCIADSECQWMTKLHRITIQAILYIHNVTYVYALVPLVESHKICTYELLYCPNNEYYPLITKICYLSVIIWTLVFVIRTHISISARHATHKVPHGHLPTQTHPHYISPLHISNQYNHEAPPPPPPTTNQHRLPTVHDSRRTVPPLSTI